MCRTCREDIVARLEEVRRSSESDNLRWAERTWLRKLFKAHKEGMRLSNTGNDQLDEVQNFLFRALRHGQVVKVVHNPFVQAKWGTCKVDFTEP